MERQPRLLIWFGGLAIRISEWSMWSLSKAEVNKTLLGGRAEDGRDTALQLLGKSPFFCRPSSVGTFTHGLCSFPRASGERGDHMSKLAPACGQTPCFP